MSVRIGVGKSNTCFKFAKKDTLGDGTVSAFGLTDMTCVSGTHNTGSTPVRRFFLIAHCKTAKAGLSRTHGKSKTSIGLVQCRSWEGLEAASAMARYTTVVNPEAVKERVDGVLHGVRDTRSIVAREEDIATETELTKYNNCSGKEPAGRNEVCLLDSGFSTRD